MKQLVSAVLLIAFTLSVAPDARADSADDAKAALAAFERQDFKAALVLLDKVLEDKTLPPQAQAAVLVYHAGAQYGLGDGDAALADFKKAAAIDPKSLDAQTNLAIVYQERRLYELAVNHNRQVVEILKTAQPSPQTVVANNRLAWLLATSPEAKVRDGKAAIDITTGSLTLMTTNWPNANSQLMANTHDTLAAGYAEAKRFKDAIATEQKAIAEIGAADPGLKAEFEKRLVSYQAGKPWRLN